MHLLTDIAALRRHLEAERRAGRRLAFVPTMGNLHEGHAALARQARSEGDLVVASIFVNRLQFAPSEDFDRYPRTLDADCATLRACGVDVLFAPTEAELYPEPQLFTVQPPEIGRLLEGEFRPGFFTGVATVVLKLFNIVQPEAAVFGKKDYQQLAVIRAMVRQLALPIRIVAGETVRASDGLALSSRNGYMSAAERAKAPELFASLQEVSDGLHRAPATALELERLTTEKLHQSGWKVDYVAVRKQADLQPPGRGEIVPGARLVVLAAARLGSMRLIDNLEVNLPD